MHKRNGFTIVELLIVIIVIGILALIGVVVFNGVRGRAYDAGVKNDMRNFVKKISLFHVDNDRYPNPSDPGDTEMLSVKYGASQGMYLTLPDVRRNLVYCTSPDRKHFAFIAKSKSGNAFYVSEATGGNIVAYTDPWTSTTYASDLCTSPLIGLSASDTDQRTGYWPGHGDWQAWTAL